MELKIRVLPEINNGKLNEPYLSAKCPLKYGPIIWPTLNEKVKKAVHTTNEPENLFWPSINDIDVIGINENPNKILDNIIPYTLLKLTQIKIPDPNIKFAKKRAKSFPILVPSQFQKKTDGIPIIPTKNHI